MLLSERERYIAGYVEGLCRPCRTPDPDTTGKQPVGAHAEEDVHGLVAELRGMLKRP